MVVISLVITKKGKKMGKISRLEVLKKELEIVKNFKCLSYSLAEDVIGWYSREISSIENFGSINPIYETEEEE